MGTLDQLVGLSDDLAKLDTAAEQYVYNLFSFYRSVSSVSSSVSYYSKFLSTSNIFVLE